MHLLAKRCLFTIIKIYHQDIQCEVIDGISDHKGVLVRFSSITNRRITKVVRVQDFACADDVSIIDRLELCYDELCYTGHSVMCDVNSLWLKFKNTVHACIELFVPSRVKKTNKSNPWMTREIIHLKRKINRLRKQLKRYNTSSLRDQIALFSRELKDKMRSERYNFYNVRLSKMIREAPAQFWRSIIPKSSLSDTFVINGDPTSDADTISNSFNEHFNSVFTTDNGAIPQYDKFTTVPPIQDLQISESGILNLLLNLDVRKSPSPDSLPNAFLKQYAEWSSKILAVIFKSSLSCGVLPYDWKMSIIKPIFKQGNKQNIPNYRPIALTCTCCKLLEHIIQKHITVFLETHSILSPAQHGFRRGFSTITQLVGTIHDFASAINGRTQIDAIFLDFAKAFDKISHSKLMIKLWATLKNSQLCNWVETYLTSRHQYVVFNDKPSNISLVFSGVPQG